MKSSKVVGMDNSVSIRKIVRKTKCDLVVDEVVSMIVTGTYKEGDRLPPENILCEKFGVSRVTLRESFKKLNMMGVLTIKQGEGTFITQTDMSMFLKPLLSSFIFGNIEINELYEARLFVESGTVALAARHRTVEDIKQLRALLAQMLIVLEDENIEEYGKLDTEFHDCIGRVGKNSVLLLIYQNVKDIFNGYIMRTSLSLGRIKESYKTHDQIVDAIQNRNEKLAIELMQEHINGASKYLLNDKSHEDPNSVASHAGS